jgi:hypothetical protein
VLVGWAAGRVEEGGAAAPRFVAGVGVDCAARVGAGENIAETARLAARNRIGAEFCI